MQHEAMAPVPAAPKKPLLDPLELIPFVGALPLPKTARTRAGHGLRIGMREMHVKVHRDVSATRVWVYHDLDSDDSGESAVAPLIEARTGPSLDVEWVNHLPTTHFLPIDHSLHGCGKGVPDVRAVVHVHGARVPSKYDGHPEDRFVPCESLTCRYPLEQDGTTLWYHDHAMGLNRLNVYAGLFGMMLGRDETEDSLHLPGGKYEVPLIVYDRNFFADGLFSYPDSGDPDHPWVSEFAGDALLINGKIRPYFEVEPQLYRLRIVNSANSRFFKLSLSNNQLFQQIGSDQGLLQTPVEMSALTFAPGERLDLLVDFSLATGQTVHLRNGALDILQFRIGKTSSSPTAGAIPTKLRTIERIAESSAPKSRGRLR